MKYSTDPECDDILNFGGFSDDAGRFVAEVESIEL